MYQTANRMLFDESATPCDKLYMLIQMSMVEHLARRIHLKEMHIKAIDLLVESYGGIAAMLTHNGPGGLEEILMRFYTNQFVRTEVSIKDYTLFARLKISLMNTLTALQNKIPWFHCCSSFDQGQSSNGYTGTQHELRQLINYLSNLVCNWRRSNLSLTSSPEDTGVLFCSFSFAMTLVEHCPCPQTTLGFFRKVQKCMRKSTPHLSKPGEELNDLHPVAVSDMIGSTRCEVFATERQWKELRIAQASVDFHKLSSLLSSVEKIEMVEWILDRVLPMKPGQRNTGTQNANFLRALDESLEKAWWTAASASEDA